MGTRWFTSIPRGILLSNSEQEALELQESLREALSPLQEQLHDLWIADKMNHDLLALSRYVTLASASLELPAMIICKRIVMARTYPYWTRYLLKDKFETFNASSYLTETENQLQSRVIAIESKIVTLCFAPKGK